MLCDGPTIAMSSVESKSIYCLFADEQTNASLSIQTMHMHTCHALEWHNFPPPQVQVLILSANKSS
jgi:hypothetical protein